MRILLISTSNNGLTQRFFTELSDANYEVSVELHHGDKDQLIEGVDLFKPDLILCPFLTRRIPEAVFKKYLCIIVHPGIKGDRGPSSLDWAIQTGISEWGVTLLQADEEMDAGDIWSSKTFPMRLATKSSIYNREVTETAIKCLWDVLTFVEVGYFKPEPLDYKNDDVRGHLQLLMQQSDRCIDWQTHTSEEILRKIHAADGNPGVLDEIYGKTVFLYNAHKEITLTGKAGEILAVANKSICRATVDGAIWIGHLKPKFASGENGVKLRASEVLKDCLPGNIETIEIDYTRPNRQLPCQEVWYEIEDGIAYLYSAFHNGAMNTEQCHILLEVYQYVASLSVKAIVLMGGADFGQMEFI